MRDAHVSGRFDAADHEWDTLLDAVAGRSNITGLTEGADAGRPPGWQRGGTYEADVLWKGRWTTEDDGVANIRTGTWRRGTRPMSSLPIRWRVLVHRDGWRLLRASTHLPAHLYRADQRRAHMHAVDQLPNTLADLMRRQECDEATLSADFNTDPTRPSTRRRLERHGFHVVAPRAPTHGLRTIDGFLTTMTGTAETLPKHKGFDHRAVVAVLDRKEHR